MGLVRTKVLLLGFSLIYAVTPTFPQQAGAPGCGDPTAAFSVTTEQKTSPAVQPEPGKALVYFIENDSNFASFPKPTTRAGLDGKWVGATHGNSYLHFAVEPGLHHLCASWQKAVLLGKGRQTSALHFTAESGGVYYFEVKNVFHQSEFSAITDMTLAALDSDEGQLRIEKYSFSNSSLKR